MSSNRTFSLQGGLGDCIVAGAALQKLARVTGTTVGYHTNPLLYPLFDGHPDIYLTNQADTQLKWVSQLPYNSFALHTMQRFSVQLGLYLDPTEVLDIYIKGRIVRNDPFSSKIICINKSSAEPTRRYIPQEDIDSIVKELGSDFDYIYLGDNSMSIVDQVSILSTARMFIGPVSFCYHLASALHVPSLLFINYMPEHKFSHIFNTKVVLPEPLGFPCRFMCEEKEKESRDRMDCWGGCRMTRYNKRDYMANISDLLFKSI